MSAVNLLDFSAGMSALVDPTKTRVDSYRLGLNLRLRKNALEPAFKHVKIDSPAGLHQAIFSNDTRFTVVVAGNLIRYTFGADGAVHSAAIGGIGTLSATADRVYHHPVPRPSNFRVSETFRPRIRTYTEAIVLQDGVSQPLLASPDGSYRTAKTYAQWDYTDPEYIPVGRFMCSNRGKLFIASADLKSIYQSVSGRMTDFVLAFDAAGNAEGDASFTSIAVAMPSLTAMQASQTGGLFVFTRYAAYTLDPLENFPLQFGEFVYQPADVFPVGAVNDISFGFVNGDTIFVSPAGIQLFNQVLQLQRSSNNSPYGAPVIDHLIRPISSAAVVNVNDYTFIALDTKYGPAILVHDNIVNAFVGFDLTAGLVKEFCAIEDNGLTRLFYITASGLYEIPLYEGDRATAAVYIGDFSSGVGNKLSRVVDVHLGFSDLTASGSIGLEVWGDGVLQDGCRLEKTLTLTEDETAALVAVPPQRLPLGDLGKTAGLSFDTSDSRLSYASSLLVTVGAAARLASVTAQVEVADQPAADPQLVENSQDEVMFIGNLSLTSVTADGLTFPTTIGSVYTVISLGNAGTLLNGATTINVRVGEAITFVAQAEILYASDTFSLYSSDALNSILTAGQETILIPRLSAQVPPTELKSIFAYHGVSPRAVLGSNEMVAPEYFYGAFRSMKRMKIELDNVDLFLLSDVTAELAVGGIAEEWLRYRINPAKHSVVCFARSPYTTASNGAEVGAADLRWDFPDIGVKLVIGGGTTGVFERKLVGGVEYVTLSAINKGLKLTALGKYMQLSYDGGADQFTILA